MNVVPISIQVVVEALADVSCSLPSEMKGLVLMLFVNWHMIDKVFYKLHLDSGKVTIQ